MSTSFQDFWAKYDPVTGATYPAILHLLDSATAAIAVYQVWLRAGLQTRLNDCLGTESVKKLALIAASHDLGKINPVFQGQLAVKSDVSSVENLFQFSMHLINKTCHFLNIIVCFIVTNPDSGIIRYEKI